MSYLHSIPKSMEYAVSGLKAAFKNEPNFRVHTVATLIVVALGVVLKLSVAEWILLTATVSGVIVLELLNTSIEATVNMVSPNVTPGAKVAKDTAAAAVLIGSTAAALIGAGIFLPKLF